MGENIPLRAAECAGLLLGCAASLRLAWLAIRSELSKKLGGPAGAALEHWVRRTGLAHCLLTGLALLPGLARPSWPVAAALSAGRCGLICLRLGRPGRFYGLAARLRERRHPGRSARERWEGQLGLGLLVLDGLALAALAGELVTTLPLPASAAAGLVAGLGLVLSARWSQPDGGSSALRESLEAKGENSYYYAHGSRATAGASPPPKLLGTVASPTSQTYKTIQRYSFCDDGAKVKLYIELPVSGQLDPSRVQLESTETSISLLVEDSPQSHLLRVNKLHKKISGCTAKVKQASNTVVLTLRKAGSGEWPRLEKLVTVTEDDGICIDGR